MLKQGSTLLNPESPRSGFWVLSVEMDSINSDSKVAINKMYEMVHELGLAPSFEEVLALGQDDVSVVIADKDEAIELAKELDELLDQASQEYIDEWGVDHNAQVFGPYRYSDRNYWIPEDNCKIIYGEA